MVVPVSTMCGPDAGKLELLCRMIVAPRMVPACTHILCEIVRKGYAVRSSGGRSRAAEILIEKGLLARTKMRMCRAPRYTTVLVANTTTVYDLIEALKALAESARIGKWCVDETEYEKDVRPWL